MTDNSAVFKPAPYFLNDDYRGSSVYDVLDLQRFVVTSELVMWNYSVTRADDYNVM